MRYFKANFEPYRKRQVEGTVMSNCNSPDVLVIFLMVSLFHPQRGNCEYVNHWRQNIQPISRNLQWRSCEMGRVSYCSLVIWMKPIETFPISREILTLVVDQARRSFFVLRILKLIVFCNRFVFLLSCFWSVEVLVSRVVLFLFETCLLLFAC